MPACGATPPPKKKQTKKPQQNTQKNPFMQPTDAFIRISAILQPRSNTKQ